MVEVVAVVVVAVPMDVDVDVVVAVAVAVAVFKETSEGGNNIIGEEERGIDQNLSNRQDPCVIDAKLFPRILFMRSRQ